jgi:ribosomal protein S18 acetylase RimI-like enzyme
MMLTRYLKRFRMEIDFRETRLARPELPSGYVFHSWHPRLLREHARVKSESFHQEMDSQMFLSLSTPAGCEDLMRGIVNHPGFLPQATWLIEFIGNPFSGVQACGTIQGLIHSTRLGSIQNVGVIPAHRGFGLGRAVVLKALRGFHRSGLQRVYLDVTAENVPAVELYRSLGFRTISTSYRELPEPIENA